MSPALRKLNLTAHVTSSVGWLGAVAGFLALAVTGLKSQDAQMVRAAYLAMDLIGRFIIIPLSLAALATGLVQALGTTWGLFRHYWVLLKFLITLLATILLLVHIRPATYLSSVAAKMSLSSADFRGLRTQLATDAGAALLALLVTTTLSVYKPRGLTPYGRRKQYEQGGTLDQGSTSRTQRWVYVFGIITVVLLFVIRHLTVGGGHGSHGH